MSLNVGIDTYITLDEANTYYAEHYVATDPLLVQWNALSNSEKEVYLRKAFTQINSLPYTGRPKNPKQVLPFPRIPENLLNVKYAQAEQAMFLTDTVTQQEIGDRARLRRAGVKAYKIGDLSETFVDGNASASNSNFFGLSEIAYNYLSIWLRGGYKICTSIKKHHGCNKLI